MTDAKQGLELVYSRQGSDFIKGRAYSNPRFYSTPRQGVSKVYVVGDYPQIVADYERMGVPVEIVDEGFALPKGRNAHPAVTGAEIIGPRVADVAREGVEIPVDWRDLKWSTPDDQGRTLRGLAAQFSDTPVLNKGEAVTAVEAELARREKPAA